MRAGANTNAGNMVLPYEEERANERREPPPAAAKPAGWRARLPGQNGHLAETASKKRLRWGAWAKWGMELGAGDSAFGTTSAIGRRGG